MRKIFDEILASVSEYITTSSNRNLFADGYNEDVYKQFIVVTPYLDYKHFGSSIENRVVTMDDPPIGEVRFMPGRTMEYALIRVPVIGSQNLFEKIASGLYRNNKYLNFNGGTLNYIEFSEQRITGNNSIIQSINFRARGTFDQIQGHLNEFKKEADNFNDNYLKNFISDIIQKEIKKRNLKSDSENMLNPFK